MNDPDAVHVVFKLPSGRRLERRFLKTHSLEVRFSIFLQFFLKLDLNLSKTGEGERQLRSLHSVETTYEIKIFVIILQNYKKC